MKLLDLTHRQNHAIRHCAVKVLDQFARTLRRTLRVRRNVHGIIAQPRLVDNAVGQFRQIRRRKARHGKRYKARMIAVEVARGNIDAVTERINNPLHMIARRLRHTSGSVNNVGRGFEGDAGFACDIA